MRIQQNRKEIEEMTKKEMMREVVSRTNQVGAAVENVCSQVETLYETLSDEEVSEEEREDIRGFLYEEVFIDAVNETIITPGAEELSEQTLRKVLAFMRSSPGLAFNEVMRRLGVDFMDEIQGRMDDALQECFNKLRD